MYQSSTQLSKLEALLSVLGRMDPQVEFLLAFIATLPALLTGVISNRAKQ